MIACVISAMLHVSASDICEPCADICMGLCCFYDSVGRKASDSTACIQVIINEMKKSQALQNMNYDLNGDGKISTADIQVIINEMKK